MFNCHIVGNNNEEGWAAKARAWAAAKVASDSQQTQHLQYPTNEGSLAADSTALYHGRDSSINPSFHQQEVPSSYSSIAGKKTAKYTAFACEASAQELLPCIAYSLSELCFWRASFFLDPKMFFLFNILRYWLVTFKKIDFLYQYC